MVVIPTSLAALSGIDHGGYYQEFIGQLDDIQRVQLLRVVQPLGPVV